MAVVSRPRTALPARAVQARQARGRRLAALFLDIVFFSIVAQIVNNVYGVTYVTSGSPPNGQAGSFFYSTVTTVGWLWLCVLLVAYYAVPEALFGASPGKLITGLRVVRVDGQPPGLGAIVLRNVVRLVDGLPLLYILGGVLALLTTTSQRLGDLVAGTTVVARGDALDAGATRSAGPAAGRLLGMVLVLALVFTVAFDYFGRPPLVVQGLYNQHQLWHADVTYYKLGAAQWTPGQVTYPITTYRADQVCTGTIQLDWSWTGWELGSGADVCKP